MGTLRLNDLVRGAVEEITIDLTSSVSDTVEVVIHDLGLPRFDLDGAPIVYELRSAASDEALEATRSLTDAGVGSGETVELVSRAGGAVWEHVRGLTMQLRTELDAGLRRGRNAVRSELRSGVERVEGAVRREVRGVIRSATQDIEAELNRRLRRTGRQLGFWARRRIRRLTAQLEATGVLPSEVDALAMATGQLRTVAQAALVVPLAGVAAVGAVAGGGSLYLSTTDDAPDLSALEARVTQIGLAAQDALDAANAAQTMAEGADRRAGDALELAQAHVADLSDPHDTAVLATIDDHVRAELDTPAAADGWVDRLLGAAQDRADRRIDAHLSTAYQAVPGVTVDVGPGESLWGVAQAVLRRDPGYDHQCADVAAIESPTPADVAAYVRRLWVANVGLIQDNADSIEAGIALQVVCPGPDARAG